MEGVYIDYSNIIGTIRAIVREELQAGIQAILDAQSLNVTGKENLCLLTLLEVRAILKVSRNTIYKLIDRGSLEPVKIGGKLMFDQKSIEKFIQHVKETI